MGQCVLLLRCKYKHFLYNRGKIIKKDDFPFSYAASRILAEREGNKKECIKTSEVADCCSWFSCILNPVFQYEFTASI